MRCWRNRGAPEATWSTGTCVIGTVQASPGGMTLKPLVRLRRGRAMAASRPEFRSRRARGLKRGWWIILAAAVGLLLVRFVGSPIATSLVNRRLAALPDVTGRVDAVNLAVWRGAVVLTDFVLYSRGHEDEPPLVHVERASMRLAPGSLFTGKIGGSAVVDGAEFNVVKRRQLGGAKEAVEEAAREIDEKKDDAARWQDTLREAFPMELTRFALKNARVRFVDYSHQPNAEMVIDDLRILVTELQNRGDPGQHESYPTRIEIRGTTTGQGRLRASVMVDPFAERPRFSANFEIKAMQLPAANSFLQAYANADVSRGTFEVYAEMDAKDGRYEGYLKPLFHDLDFRTASDEHKSPAKRVAEKVVTAVASVLENDDKEQVATKAPFSGNFADNRVDVWSTITTLLSNAFVQALRGGFERQTPRA